MKRAVEKPSAAPAATSDAQCALWSSLSIGRSTRDPVTQDSAQPSVPVVTRFGEDRADRERQAGCIDGNESPDHRTTVRIRWSRSGVPPSENFRTSVLTAVKALASSIDPSSRQPPGSSIIPASNQVPGQEHRGRQCILRAVGVLAVEAVGDVPTNSVADVVVELMHHADRDERAAEFEPVAVSQRNGDVK